MVLDFSQRFITDSWSNYFIFCLKVYLLLEKKEAHAISQVWDGDWAQMEGGSEKTSNGRKASQLYQETAALCGKIISR